MERSNEDIPGRRATDDTETGEIPGLSEYAERTAELAAASAAAGTDLLARARAIEAAGVHRRHEELMEIAIQDGVAVELFEQAHELANEEGLAPAYALALVASNVGVEELIAPISGDDESIQQTPPEWVATGDVSREAIKRERLLRAAFRRFRAHLERTISVEEAVKAFLDEPDVGPVVY